MQRPTLSRKTMRNATRLGVLAMVLGIAVAIVGFHSHAHSHGDLTVRDARGTAVTVNEWKLGKEPAAVDGALAAGGLQFSLQNTDNVAHDFYVVRADGEAGALPVANGQVDFAGIGEIVASVQAFAPGESGVLEFDFDPGEYVLFCNQAGHYEHGMYYRFAVK